MASNGLVRANAIGGFKGKLQTLAISADIDIISNDQKASDSQPDYRVLSESIEIGAGGKRSSEASGHGYGSLSLAAPEFGPRRLYANLGRASGDDDESFALIWNPAD